MKHRIKENDVLEAFRFAEERHKGQKRKNEAQDDYIQHPMRVASDTYTLTHDQTLTCAAVLHDTLEDTETSYNEILDKFGKEVANIVQELTVDREERKSPPYNGDYGKYFIDKMINMSNGALTIKLVDRLDNILDLPTTIGYREAWKNKYARQTMEIITSLIKYRKLNKIQKELAYKIERRARLAIND